MKVQLLLTSALGSSGGPYGRGRCGLGTGGDGSRGSPPAGSRADGHPLSLHGGQCLFPFTTWLATISTSWPGPIPRPLKGGVAGHVRLHTHGRLYGLIWPICHQVFGQNRVVWLWTVLAWTPMIVAFSQARGHADISVDSPLGASHTHADLLCPVLPSVVTQTAKEGSMTQYYSPREFGFCWAC